MPSHKFLRIAFRWPSSSPESVSPWQPFQISHYFAETDVRTKQSPLTNFYAAVDSMSNNIHIYSPVWFSRLSNTKFEHDKFFHWFP